MLTNTWRVGVKRMGPSSFQWCPVTGQGAMGTSWSIGSSVWTWGRISSLWGWRSTGTGCPGRLWSLLLWRCSRPAWTRSCAACCGWPCFGRGLDWVTHRGPFQPPPFCDSVILWFCDSMLTQPHCGAGWQSPVLLHRAAAAMLPGCARLPASPELRMHQQHGFCIHVNNRERKKEWTVNF